MTQGTTSDNSADGNVEGSMRRVDAKKDVNLALRDAEEALQRLQKIEAMGKLMGGVAHDINNLQHGIVSALELVRRLIAAGRTGETERFIASAILSAQRTSALNERLVQFSRRQAVDCKPVAIDELIAGIVELLRHAFPKDTKIDWHPTADAWKVNCDASQVELAIVNLAINAHEAMPQGGTMAIQAANIEWTGTGSTRAPDIVPGQYVCVCVTDSGTGMSEDIMRRAFAPFFTAQTGGAGTGLGLTMARRIARQCGGDATVDSAQGRGTSVRLYLPRHRSAG
jgi:signal transduction histidine kinase